MGGGNSKNGYRSFGLDLVRAFAIFAVVGGHFFTLNTHFRDFPMGGLLTVSGWSMLVQSMAQFLFSGGVPLFILLTGYLNLNKKLSRKYYKGIWRVLIAYLFYSVLCIAFKQLYLHEGLSAKEIVLQILAYESFTYGWYIEMWIGLFLLIPFLNVMYHNLQSVKQKQVLIATMAVMTFLPILTNRYGLKLFPGYWEQLYPLGFYFIGAFLREFKPKYSKWKMALILLILISLNGVSSMILADGQPIKQLFGDCFGLVGAVSGVLTFLLLYDVKCNVKWITSAIYWVSFLSLDMYLGCWMFDRLIYPYFLDNYYTDQPTFGLFFFIIVPAVLLGSFLLAGVKHILFSFVSSRSSCLSPNRIVKH